MARLTGRGKDLFCVRKVKSLEGGEVINRIEVELRYKDNGNLLRRVRTFFKPGFLDGSKNFTSSGWKIESRGLPLTSEEILSALLKAGFEEITKDTK